MVLFRFFFKEIYAGLTEGDSDFDLLLFENKILG